MCKQNTLIYYFVLYQVTRADSLKEWTEERPREMSKVVWNVNVCINWLFSLLVTCVPHFSCYCFWKTSSGFGIWILQCKSIRSDERFVSFKTKGFIRLNPFLITDQKKKKRLHLCWDICEEEDAIHDIHMKVSFWRGYWKTWVVFTR